LLQEVYVETVMILAIETRIGLIRQRKEEFP
jgi:hypothetical protein